MTSESVESELKRNAYELLAPQMWQKHPILIGVSGGPDSVALLRLVHNIASELNAGPLHVAHANHHLRGDESDQDEIWVKKLCSQLSIPCHVHQCPPGSSTPDGVESKLRDARYEMFKQVSAQVGARYVMTAHNRNDQTETILFRILRGTGIAGLTGIPASRELCPGVTLVRPLLLTPRDQILGYLSSIGQSYRTDPSNQECEYARNRIRNRLIPLIQNDLSPQFDYRIESLSKQARQHQEFLDHHCQPLLESHIEFLSDRCTVDTSKLRHQLPIVIRRILVMAWQKMDWPLQNMTFAKWNELAILLERNDKPTVLNLPGQIRCTFENDQMRFERQLNSSG